MKNEVNEVLLWLIIFLLWRNYVESLSAAAAAARWLEVSLSAELSNACRRTVFEVFRSDKKYLRWINHVENHDVRWFSSFAWKFASLLCVKYIFKVVNFLHQKICSYIIFLLIVAVLLACSVSAAAADDDDNHAFGREHNTRESGTGTRSWNHWLVGWKRRSTLDSLGFCFAIFWDIRARRENWRQPKSACTLHDATVFLLYWI